LSLRRQVNHYRIRSLHTPQPKGQRTPQAYKILKFILLFFGLNSILLAVSSILTCVGVNSLIIIGGVPIIELRWKEGMISPAPLWTVSV